MSETSLKFCEEKELGVPAALTVIETMTKAIYDGSRRLSRPQDHLDGQAAQRLLKAGWVRVSRRKQGMHVIAMWREYGKPLEAPVPQWQALLTVQARAKAVKTGLGKTT